MELRDPRNRKMQNLIAFSVSAGIHLTGLFALLSIDACGKNSSDKAVVTAVAEQSFNTEFFCKYQIADALEDLSQKPGYYSDYQDPVSNDL